MSVLLVLPPDPHLGTALKMSTPNPLKETQSTPPPPVSVKTFHIAGILTDVYGLDELPQTCKSVSCLWLLHGRLQSKEVMAGVASACINDWKLRRPSGNEVGLLAIAFDQRNHGSRLINALANEAWKGGNETHAQDMFRYPTFLCISSCSD